MVAIIINLTFWWGQKIIQLSKEREGISGGTEGQNPAVYISVSVTNN